MPRIGRDEWVAQADELTERYQGIGAPLVRAWNQIGPGWKFAAFVAVAAVFPFTTDSAFLIRTGLTVLLFAILALGLNVVVGWTGMLDLGYVAFYGFGAYGYAFVASDKFGFHWPTEAAIPAIVVATALFGLLLGLPSRRLIGDYLAIMTLFFGQLFVEVALNLDRLKLPFSDRQLSITGGPNGIPGLDNMSLFGYEFAGIGNKFRDYFYLLLIFLVLLVIGLHHLNQSRTGRAWRSIREDPLAAGMMTVPVNRLRLLAFACGAGIAGLSGTVFAAVQVGVFPQNFEVLLLIMIYAALILGGAGVIPGAILGAIVIASVPEILRQPDSARWLFYLGLVLVLVVRIRPWPRLAAVLAAVIAFGFAIHAIVAAADPGGTAGEAAKGGVFADVIGSWVVLPATDQETIGNFAFVALIIVILALTQIRGLWRTVALVPALYLGVFLWENRLVFEPSVTRQLLFGAVLIVMMAARPHGLLGKPRVEIV